MSKANMSAEQENLSPENEQPNAPESQFPSKEQMGEFLAAEDLIENIFKTESPDYDSVITFLKSLGMEVPIFSTTPPHLLDMLKAANVPVKVIPISQKDHEAFQVGNSTTDDSEVPEWFRQAQEQLKKEKRQRRVDVLNALNERKWLLSMVVLGIAAGAGFSMGWAIKTPNVMNTIDMYWSIYGIAAVSRSVWQMSRAGRWNKKARNETRHHYADILPNFIDEEQRENPAVSKVLTKADKLTKGSTRLDYFLEEFGLNDRKKANPKKTSVLEELFAAQGKEFDRKTVTAELSKKIIEQQFGEKPPSIAVVIPTYQTSLEEMKRLLVTIKNQVYPVTNAYVVYNDDPNDPDPERREKKQPQFIEFQRLVDKLNTESGSNSCRIQLFAQPARGKREAMAMGFATALGKSYIEDLKVKYPKATEAQLSKAIGNLNINELPDFRHDFVLNIDSDTEIFDNYSVLSSLLLMKQHPEAATTTGDVRVTNRKTNTLSEMTYQRYWRAFFVERAAQSLDGNVTCMSGPWVCMRSEALAEVFDEWYFQEFLGVRSTYGDDRHLSTLFLMYGWKSLFNPDSAVLTDCPTDWKVFLRQQLRWNKSFNRENFILFKFLHKLDKFTQMDVMYQQSFAFVMIAILSQILFRAGAISLDQGLVAGATSVAPYAAAVLAYNELFFGLYGTLKNQDPQFLKSPIYIWYHFRALLRLKLIAFFKLKDSGWGTKGESPTQSAQTPVTTEPDSLAVQADQKIEAFVDNIMDEMEREIGDLSQDEENNQSSSTANGESL